MQLIEYFDKGVEVDPGRAFLIGAEGQRSYVETQRFSYAFANLLAREGVAPGTRVAVYSGNSCRAFECVIGMLRRGCVWVPINVHASIDDTVFVLNNTETELLFYSETCSERVAQLLGSCRYIRRAICLERADGDHAGLDELLRDVPTTPSEVRQAPDDVITLFSSGGTTGRPKGVMMTHRSWEMIIANTQRLNWCEQPVNLVAAPMTHAAGGSALALMGLGTSNVVLPGFDPVAIMRAIEQHRVTHFFLPPTALYRMLSHPEIRQHDYSSLRYFTFAGAPMAPEKIKEAVAVFGPVMVTGLGQTEIGTNVTYFAPEDIAAAVSSGNERRLSSCGRASPFARAEIMDDEGRLLPPETPGEIVIRGSMVMKGYYNDPVETERAQAFGWHHTGDIGIKDVEGWLYLLDRKRDLIISGGFNVFPSEVEKVILAHPAIQDCAVVGVPDSDWGEAVTAVVELKRGMTLDYAELRAFCKGRLGDYSVPKALQCWPELPRSPNGKILRRVVREGFWQGRERKI